MVPTGPETRSRPTMESAERAARDHRAAASSSAASRPQRTSPFSAESLTSSVGSPSPDGVSSGCDVIVEKQLRVHAASTLRQPAAAIARRVSTFGRTLGSPWRVDDKAAATAAWIALATHEP